MLRRALSTIDLFGMPIMVNFSRKQKFKSAFGGVCTLLFLGFVVWMIYNGSINLFYKNTPKTIISETFNPDPRQIILSPKSFPVAFGVQAPDHLNFIHFVDKSIYDINVFHSRVEKIVYDNGTFDSISTTTPIQTEKCTPEHFGELAETFSLLQLDLLFCLSLNQPALNQISIQGSAESVLYESISFQIIQCNNETSSITCSTEEKINEYLDGSWFYAYHGDMAANPKNYARPDSVFRDAYYAMISPANYRYSILNLGHVEITTDSGWLIEQSSTKNYAKVDEIEAFITFTPHPQKVLITFDVQLSKLEKYYYRSYTKIQEVLAGASGMANALLLVLVLVIAPFMKAKLYETIMNDAFDIDLSDPSNTKTRTNKRKKKYVKKHSSKEENNTQQKPEVLTFNHIQVKLATVHSSPDDEKIKEDTTSTITLFERNRSTIQIREDKTSTNKYGSIPPLGKFTSQNQFNLGVADMSSISNRDSFFPEVSTSTDRIRLNKIYGKLSAKVFEDPIDNQKSKDVSFFSDNSFEDEQKSKTEKDEIAKIEKANKTEELDSPTLEKMSSMRETKSLKLKKEASSDVQEDIEANNNSKKCKSTKPKISLITFRCFISSCLRRSEVQKQRRKLLNEGRRGVEERLDILNIMRKLRDIDKLLALLFESDQLVLFDNLPKPELKIKKLEPEQTDPVYDRLKNPRFIRKTETMEQIKESLERVTNKSIKSQLDMRLLQIYGKSFASPED